MSAEIDDLAKKIASLAAIFEERGIDSVAAQLRNSAVDLSNQSKNARDLGAPEYFDGYLEQYYWKTVNERGLSMDEYLAELDRKSIKIFEDNRALLSGMDTSAAVQDREVRLGRIALEQLAVENEAPMHSARVMKNLLPRIRKLGGASLSIASALELRLDYVDQPEGEFLTGAMYIPHKNGGAYALTLYNNLENRLGVNLVSGDVPQLRPESEIVFALPSAG